MADFMCFHKTAPASFFRPLQELLQNDIVLGKHNRAPDSVSEYLQRLAPVSRKAYFIGIIFGNLLIHNCDPQKPGNPVDIDAFGRGLSAGHLHQSFCNLFNFSV
ncbi:MAG: hypothetical protein ACLVJV_05520 [Oscillospiraceae bacterium]